MRAPTNIDAVPRTTVGSVRAVGLLFVAIGLLDLWRGLAPLAGPARPPRLAGDDLVVIAIGVVALVAGVGVFRGVRWARGVLAAWMAVHLVIGAGNPTEFAVHVVLFGCVAFALFGRRAGPHFAAPARG